MTSRHRHVGKRISSSPVKGSRELDSSGDAPIGRSEVDRGPQWPMALMRVSAPSLRAIRYAMYRLVQR